MQDHDKLRTLTNAQLLGRLSDLVRQSRRVEADLIAHIGEVDARRLYLGEATPSMFAYATRILHLSEAEAYLRITVARAAREHPALLTMLATGDLHLSGAGLLAPHLTIANRSAVLARATNRSKRQIEELIAEMAPRPDVPAMIRKLPEQSTSTASTARSESVSVPGTIESQPFPEGVGVPPAESSGTTATAGDLPLALPQGRVDDRTEPIGRARYRVQFTASETMREKLQRLQALVPGADLAAVIEQAVTEKLERLEAKRFGKTRAPRKLLAVSDASRGRRYVPAPVRRAVYERDGGRCAFVDASGHRCGERSRLEFHHRHPYGYGGEPSADNISLQCRPHNLYQAEIDYGKDAIARYRRGWPRRT